MSDIDFSDWSNEDINDAITSQGQRIQELEKAVENVAIAYGSVVDATSIPKDLDDALDELDLVLSELKE